MHFKDTTSLFTVSYNLSDDIHTLFTKYLIEESEFLEAMKECKQKIRDAEQSIKINGPAYNRGDALLVRQIHLDFIRFLQKHHKQFIKRGK